MRLFERYTTALLKHGRCVTLAVLFLCVFAALKLTQEALGGEMERLVYLLGLYNKHNGPLIKEEKKKRKNQENRKNNLWVDCF